MQNTLPKLNLTLHCVCTLAYKVGIASQMTISTPEGAPMREEVASPYSAIAISYLFFLVAFSAVAILSKFSRSSPRLLFNRQQFWRRHHCYVQAVRDSALAGVIMKCSKGHKAMHHLPSGQPYLFERDLLTRFAKIGNIAAKDTLPGIVRADIAIGRSASIQSGKIIAGFLVFYSLLRLTRSLINLTRTQAGLLVLLDSFVFR